jgi:hypothetical protein
MDIIEIEPDNIDLDNIKLSLFNDDIEIIQSKPSVNFGGGIELLMNDKQKNNKNNTSNIDLEDITNLENELNDLNDVKYENNDNHKEINLNTKHNEKPNKSLFHSIFDKPKNGDNVQPVSNLGTSTSKINDNKTYDGYGKFNNIPFSQDEDIKKQLSPEELLKKKFDYLKKLETLEKKGISLSQRYSMESNLDEMIGEYETLVANKEKQNSVKFQGKMMMACITGLEFLNNKFDPFDIKLEGWCEQINENIEDYDDIFSELHEKYKSKAKMSPEIKLLFQLGGSAMMVHMSNTLFKSSMPGMDDIMRQNPELMRQFSQAAVNTMGQTNPGFGNFMSGIFNQKENGQSHGLGQSNQDRRPPPPNANIGPPPSSINTQLQERSKREPFFINRPDIINARQGVSIEHTETNINDPQITRPEMSGPSQSIKQNNINNLLSGLKTRQNNVNDNDPITISADDLKDLTGVKTEKLKRKQKSDKNTMSLDI